MPQEALRLEPSIIPKRQDLAPTPTAPLKPLGVGGFLVVAQVSHLGENLLRRQGATDMRGVGDRVGVSD